MFRVTVKRQILNKGGGVTSVTERDMTVDTDQDLWDVLFGYRVPAPLRREPQGRHALSDLVIEWGPVEAPATPAAQNPAETAAAQPLTMEEVRIMFPMARDDSCTTGSAITAGLRERGMLAAVPDSDRPGAGHHYWITRDGFHALVRTLAAREQWVMLGAVARGARVTLEGADDRERLLANLAALKVPASE